MQLVMAWGTRGSYGLQYRCQESPPAARRRRATERVKYPCDAGAAADAELAEALSTAIGATESATGTSKGRHNKSTGMRHPRGKHSDNISRVGRSAGACRPEVHCSSFLILSETWSCCAPYPFRSNACDHVVPCSTLRIVPYTHCKNSLIESSPVGD